MNALEVDYKLALRIILIACEMQSDIKLILICKGSIDLVLLETTRGQRLSPLQHPQSLRMETPEQVSPCGPMLCDT